MPEVNKDEAFDQILLEAIDEGLLSLGESAKKATLFHLEDHFKIRKSDIPSRIEGFADALEKIFGPGARLVEILIMKSLHTKIGVACKWSYYKNPLNKQVAPEVTFQKFVGLMQQIFEAEDRDKTVIGVLVY